MQPHRAGVRPHRDYERPAEGPLDLRSGVGEKRLGAAVELAGRDAQPPAADLGIPEPERRAE
jgi:hypothetical protein